jgi:DNA-binding CsgD family transcriptional regulator
MNSSAGADPLPEGLLAQAADALAWPMLLLGADAALLWANRAARVLLDEQRVLALRGGRVHAPGRPAGELTALLAAARLDAAPALLHWPDPGATFTVHALAPPPEPRWMLLLSLARLPAGAGADLRAWAAAVGLSAAETRVLLRVAAGDSAREAAAALGIAPAIVRSQLRAIGRKTGLGGVAALQRALTRLPPVAAPAPAPAQGK